VEGRQFSLPICVKKVEGVNKVEELVTEEELTKRLDVRVLLQQHFD
jgi:hypothetical protein